MLNDITTSDIITTIFSVIGGGLKIVLAKFYKIGLRINWKTEENHALVVNMNSTNYFIMHLIHMSEINYYRRYLSNIYLKLIITHDSLSNIYLK